MVVARNAALAVGGAAPRRRCGLKARREYEDKFRPSPQTVAIATPV